MAIGSTAPGHTDFLVKHLLHGSQEQNKIPRQQCCYQDDLVFFQEM